MTGDGRRIIVWLAQKQDKAWKSHLKRICLKTHSAILYFTLGIIHGVHGLSGQTVVYLVVGKVLRQGPEIASVQSRGAVSAQRQLTRKQGSVMLQLAGQSLESGVLVH